MKTKNLFFFTITPISVLFTLFITSSLWSAPAPLIPDSGPIVYLLKPILVALVYVLGISVVALLISDGIFVPFHKRLLPQLTSNTGVVFPRGCRQRHQKVDPY